MGQKSLTGYNLVSRAITEADVSSTVAALEIPAKTLVKKVVLIVTEAFNAGDISVQDGATASGWIHTDDITETSIGTYAGDETTTGNYYLGKYYSTSDTIDVVLGAGINDGTAYLVADCVYLGDIL